MKDYQKAIIERAKKTVSAIQSIKCEEEYLSITLIRIFQTEIEDIAETIEENKCLYYFQSNDKGLEIIVHKRKIA